MNNLLWLTYDKTDNFIQLFLFEPLYTTYSWNLQKSKQLHSFELKKPTPGKHPSLSLKKEKHKISVNVHPVVTFKAYRHSQNIV